MIVILAHEGGRDEFLLVIAPIVVIVVLLAVVKRRVDARSADAPVPSDDETQPLG
ncbi:MAG: hypothetical protein ABIP17_04725 [Ilumatobacteraceae bacterium]